MYIKIGFTLLNMKNVDHVTTQYDEDNGSYYVDITFASGATCNNRFETKEEAEALFNEILVALDTVQLR